MSRKRQILKYIAVTLAAVLIIGTGFFAYWVNDAYEPNEIAQEAMLGTEELIVEDKDWITFDPVQPAQKGFIFYPGGLVEPEAYAPFCRKVAEAGIKVVIVPMRWNLAVLSPDRAEDVLNAYPEITDWTIGGHSLGGVIAASFAAKNDKISKIVLLASYPQEGVLDDTSCEVLSIYGSLDGVAKMDKVKDSNLGPNGRRVEIPGGNHCYFGSYGMQKGDNQAEISNDEQTDIAARETIDLIQGGR